jgi:predicted transglutaminase-like cysteine proteinase
MGLIRNTGPAVCAGLLIAGAAVAGPTCTPLELQVWRIETPPTQYTAFCAREPAACALDGAPILDWDATKDTLSEINILVNTTIRSDSDMACYGLEELWTFPEKGWGDCEDFALLKRRELVEMGLPSAAFTMAIVHHEVRLFPHAVLVAETTAGSFVLDQLHDDVLCWDALPYRWERRERPDGRWVRYALP